MSASRAVVFGVFVRAAFRLAPALQWWEALTLPTKLVDACDAVRIWVASAGEGLRLTVRDRRVERPAAAIGDESGVAGRYAPAGPVHFRTLEEVAASDGKQTEDE